MMRNTFSSQEWLKFIGKEKLQTFQDSFARVDNISLCFFDLEGTPLTCLLYTSPSPRDA